MENRKDDLQQMLKEKYEEVKVPKEAKERMKMGGEFPHLFVPGTIGTLKLKNRLVMPAMGTGLANEDGTVSEALTTFYEIRAKGGAGLGLSVCQRIVALHGGTMEFESTPGQGTSVRVHLKGGGQS